MMLVQDPRWYACIYMNSWIINNTDLGNHISIDHAFKAMPLHSTQELNEQLHALILILAPLKKSCPTPFIPMTILLTLCRGDPKVEVYFILHRWTIDFFDLFLWLGSLHMFLHLNGFYIFKILISPQSLHVSLILALCSCSKHITTPRYDIPWGSYTLLEGLGIC